MDCVRSVFRNTISFHLSHLSEVVEVVFVMNPSVIGSQTVGLVGDVLHVETHAVVKLPFEELRRQTHTARREKEVSFDWLKSCQWQAILCSAMSVAGTQRLMS